VTGYDGDVKDDGGGRRRQRHRWQQRNVQRS
jgi:hypothetical protein